MLSPDFNAIKDTIAYDQYKHIIKISELNNETTKANYVKLAGGKYFINESSELTFLISYAISIYKNSVPSTLSQIPTNENSPIRFDFDFRGKLPEVNKLGLVPDGTRIEERLITEELCMYIITSVRDLLVEHFDTYTKIYLLVREYAQINDSGIIKDGIHIIVPDMHISKFLQSELIRDLCIRMDFKQYGMINDIKDIIDKCIPTNSWILYGGRKHPNGHTYKLAYEHENNKTSEPIDDIEYHMRLVIHFSIHRNEKVYTSKTTKEKEKMIYKPILGENNTEITQSMIDITKIILDKLPSTYYTNYNDWLDIGWTLSSASKKDPRFLEIWLNYSKRSDVNYDEAEAYRIWNEAKIGLRDIYHLYNLAKANLSQKEYEEIKSMNITDKLTKMILQGKTEPLDFAELISFMIKDTKRTEVIKDKDLDLYRFDNIWIKENSAKNVLLNDIKKIYSDLLPEAMKKVTAFLMKKSISVSTNDDDDTLKRIGKLNGVLKPSMIRFKNIASALSELNIANGGIQYPGFSSYLDSTSSKIIAFKNCVVDLKTGLERPGLQEDNLSFYFPVNYTKYDPKSNEAIQLDLLLKDWFPNEKYRTVVIDKLSLCLLHNINGDNQVFFFKGSGKNGKSVFMGLLRECFGTGETGLAKTVPIDFFISGNKSQLGAASPDLYRTKGAKMILTEETNQNDKLNVALFKKLTGGDMLSVRDLYKPVVEFKCAFRIFFAVNNMPKFTSIDDSLSRRVVIIPFENRFVLSPKQKNERKIIDDIDDIIKQVAPCFMSYLVENYKNKFMGKDKKKICIIPDEVMKKTLIYINDSSPIKKFINTNIIKTGDQNDKIEIDMIIKNIYSWGAKNNYSVISGYDPTTIKDALEYEFGDAMGDKYIDSIKLADTLPDII